MRFRGRGDTTATEPIAVREDDSLTGPIPWGWPFAERRVALTPAALRIRTGSPIETWLVRPAITIAAVLAMLEVVGIPSHPR